MSDLDSLLDSQLDDLADMPEFKIYPAGAHRVIFNWESKEINKKPAVEFKFRAVETMELVDPNKDAPLAQGDECNVLLILKNNDGAKNEFSEGTLKMVAKELQTSFGGSSIKETLDNAKDAEVVIVTKVRENKNNPGTFNMSLVKLSVV